MSTVLITGILWGNAGREAAVNAATVRTLTREMTNAATAARNAATAA